MLGRAALAMWWDMAPERREEFEHWHTHEHFAERLALPGFLRGARWAQQGGDGFFILYELAAYEALVSPEYLARLDDPTPWSRAMMPHHRNMVRSPCHVLASSGSAISGSAMTMRLSPAAGQEERLRGALQALVPALAAAPGLCGAHLLRTELPAIAPTTEQRIRGLSDRAADWVLVVNAYDPQALDVARQAQLSPAACEAMGTEANTVTGRYALRASAVAS